jgi:hypothetical protein
VQKGKERINGKIGAGRGGRILGRTKRSVFIISDGFPKDGTDTVSSDSHRRY